MRILYLNLIAFLLSSCALCSPAKNKISFVIKGKRGQVLYQADVKWLEHESVEGLSRRLLNQTSQNYLEVEGAIELMGIKNFNEGNDPNNYKAYGW